MRLFPILFGVALLAAAASAIPCSPTNCNNHGTCDTATGVCNCATGWSGLGCTACKPGYFGSGCNACPGGASNPCNGQGSTCDQGLGGSGQCTCFPPRQGTACDMPVIESVTPVNGPTSGGTVITVSGYFLGGQTDSFTVLSGGVCSSRTQSSTQVVCTMPAGQPLAAPGGGLVGFQVTTSVGTSAAKYVFAYDAPRVTSINPTNGPVAANTVVTVNGLNFGAGSPAPTVVVGTLSVALDSACSLTHTRLCIKTPFAAGVQDIRVTLATQQSAVVAADKFSYDAPVVNGYTPSGPTTSGSTSIVLSGKNFGNSNPEFGTLTVTLGSLSCTPTARSDTSVTCTTPAGQGSPASSVTVNGRTTSFSFAYGAPTISAVTGCSVNTNPTTSSCNPAGGETITITGTNFGTSVTGVGSEGSLSVTVGGLACTSPSIPVAHTQVQCVLPKGAGFNLPVVVARSSSPPQQASQNYVSYVGPVITKGLLRKVPGTPATDGTGAAFVNTPTMQGGETVELQGTNFLYGNNASSVRVWYGPASRPLKYPCTNLAGLTNTLVQCKTRAGAGKNLQFTLLTNGFYSAPSADYYTYPAPTVTTNTLRPFGSLIGQTDMQASGTEGELITFNGTNFGSDPSEISVTYGSYQCILSTAQKSANTWINCQTVPGAGALIKLRVTTGSTGQGGLGPNEQSVLGLNTYTYPVSPVVDKVTGCGAQNPQNLNQAVNCTTEGSTVTNPVTLTIWGQNFGPFPLVTIGGLPCLSVANVVGSESTRLTCQLPEGTGTDLLVVVKQGNFFSRGQPLVSFGRPLVQVVRGCPTNDLANTADCVRAGGNVITLSGLNFGAGLAKVIVGGVSCQNVTHVQPSPHRKLTCKIAAGTGPKRSVVVLQDRGDFSQDGAYISYAECQPGTFIQGLNCPQCQTGKYTAVSSQDQCLDCPPGTFANAMGTSLCGDCAAGKVAATSGLTGCSPCVAGQYLATTGGVVCLSTPVGTYSSGGGATAYIQCIEGEYQPDPAAIQCLSCPQGHYSDAKQQPTCQKCQSGQYTGTQGRPFCDTCQPGTRSEFVLGSTQCLPCVAGTYSDAQRDTCTPCPPGRFSTQGSSTCTTCPSGRYQSRSGNSTCANCGFGAVSDVGAVECQLCAPGSFASSIQASVCQQCLPGKFQDQARSGSCKPCTKGQYQPSVGLTSCLLSPAGKFANVSGLVNPFVCPSGTFSALDGSWNCTSCQPGRYTAVSPTGSGFATCLSCNPGQAQPSAKQSGCLECTPGRASNTTRRTSCFVCPAGTSSAASAVECAPCVPGTFSGAPQASGCVDCAVGRAQLNPGSSVCAQCTPGYFSNTQGTTACKLCPSGSYSNTSLATKCYLCVPGKYSAALSAPTVCTDCEMGKISNDFAQPACQACPIGWYMPARGQKVCGKCEPGRFSAVEGAADCDKCPPGRALNAFGGGDCTPCEQGKYVNVSQALACLPCDIGSYSPVTGASRCLLCAPGTYNPSPGQVVCALCQTGHASFTPGSDSCTKCGKGTQQPGLAQSTCDACVPGRFNDEVGQDICKVCPTGRFQNVTGQQDCRTCEPGSFSNSAASGAPKCTLCPLGFVTPLTGAVACSPCGLGSYSGTLGQTSCTPCDRGKFADTQSRASCTPCPAGKSTNIQSSPACQDCLAGFHTNTTGNQVCTACEPGRFQVVSGQSFCDLCARGKFVLTSGQSACVDAPPGLYAPSRGMVSPISCPDGQYQPESGMSQCVDCDPGLYTSPSTGKRSCTLCLPGTHAPRPGMDHCDNCPAGRYQLSRGASFCENCRNGTFQNAAAATECVPCTAGSYADRPGHVSCPKCPLGTYQDLDSASNCLDCSPGRYSGNTTGLTRCLVCSPGKFSLEISRATACGDCPGGRYSQLLGSSECKICSVGRYSVAGSSSCAICAARTVTATPGSVVCAACTENAVASDDRTTCICNEGYYADELDEDTTTIPCFECPHGALCDRRGLTRHTIMSQPGWWRANDDTLQFYRCLLPTHCDTAISGLHNDSCLGHRAGKLCAECEEGYQSQSVTSPCVECPNSKTGLPTAISLCVLLVIGVFFMYWLVLRVDQRLIKHIEQLDKESIEWDKYDIDVEVKLSKKAMSGDLPLAKAPKYSRLSNVDPSGHLKIIVSFLQILTNMAFVLDVEWPPTYSRFIALFNFINLDFIPWQSVGCVTSLSYFVRIYVVLGVPAGLVLLIVLLFLAPSYRRDTRRNVDADSRRVALKRSRRKFWKLVLFSLFLLYPNVASSVFGYFVCRDIMGVSNLIKSIKIVCYEGEWNANLPYVLLGVAAYPIGIPLFCGLLLRRYRTRLLEPGVRLQLGFLYASYSHEIYYFELVDMLNKLLMVAVIAFLPAWMQMPAALVTTVLYIVTILLARPYVRKGHDRLAIMAETEILLVVLAAYVMSVKSNSLDKSVDLTLSILFISIVVGTMFVFAVMVIRAVHKLVRRLVMQGKCPWQKGGADEYDAVGEDEFFDGLMDPATGAGNGNSTLKPEVEAEMAGVSPLAQTTDADGVELQPMQQPQEPQYSETSNINPLHQQVEWNPMLKPKDDDEGGAGAAARKPGQSIRERLEARGAMGEETYDQMMQAEAKKEQEEAEAKAAEAARQAKKTAKAVSTVDKLKELAEMKKEGLLSEEEFAAAKAKLLKL